MSLCCFAVVMKKVGLTDHVFVAALLLLTPMCWVVLVEACCRCLGIPPWCGTLYSAHPPRRSNGMPLDGDNDSGLVIEKSTAPSEFCLARAAA